MAKIFSWQFSPPVEESLLKKGLKKVVSRAAQDPPSYAVAQLINIVKKLSHFNKNDKLSHASFNC